MVLDYWIGLNVSYCIVQKILLIYYLQYLSYYWNWYIDKINQLDSIITKTEIELDIFLVKFWYKQNVIFCDSVFHLLFFLGNKPEDCFNIKHLNIDMVCYLPSFFYRYLCLIWSPPFGFEMWHLQKDFVYLNCGMSFSWNVKQIVTIFDVDDILGDR